MGTVFYDTKRIRHNGTVRTDRNHAPVLPLKPMSFLVNYGQTTFSNKPVNPVHRLPIIFVTLRQIPKNQQSCKR